MPPVFWQDSSCTFCELHETAQSVCIPTRPWQDSHPGGAAKAPKALLIIGEAPAANEDEQGCCFVGQSGHTLDKWLTACNLDGVADIYLTNIIRCRLPGKAKPTAKQFKACHGYLVGDINKLQVEYPEVHLLVLGAEAAKGIGYGSLSKLLNDQGTPREVSGVGSVPVWATYHPAYTLPRRNPNAAFAVADHLELLCRHLTGQANHRDDPTPVLCPARPVFLPEVLASDTETYGIIESLPSHGTFRCFQPSKSLWIDGILNPSDLIQTAHVAHRAPSGGIRSGSFLWAKDWHREAYRLWLASAKESGRWVLWMNAQYDLQMLRAAHPIFKSVLDHHLQVEDLAVWNYLCASERTARGLKPLSHQLGVTKYEEGGKGKFVRYDEPTNPRLLSYGQKDCEATLESRDRLRADIAKQYGADSPKLSEYTRQWFSRVIWLATYMSENGVAMSRAKLRALRKRTQDKVQWCQQTAWESYNLYLAGKGSQSSIQTLIESAAEEAEVLGHDELVLTEKTKDISTSESNLRLIAGNLPPGDTMNQIMLLRQHRAARKLLSTYIQPLIGPWVRWEKGEKPPRKADMGQMLVGPLGQDIGFAHPSWYVVPSTASDADDKESGTKQGRWAAKRPSPNTWPPSMMACMVSRFPGGTILKLDLSQAELRTAALLSQDEVMLDEFRRGIDLHTQGAKAIAGPNVESRPDFKMYRHAAKQGNFAVVYRGSAPVLRLTILKETGKDMGLDFCRRVVNSTRSRYQGLWAWQDGLIKEVTGLGYYSDPVLGLGRQFLHSLFLNQTDYESTICDCPIQLITACILLDAFMSTAFEVVDSGMKSLAILNIHDAAVFDCPADEADTVEKIFARQLTNSDYRHRLQKLLNTPPTGAVDFPYERQ